MRPIHALALAVDAKDHYTRNHSERVALYATAIAVRMELPIEHIEQIAIAGTLHDVGKIAVPDRVLLKPTALTDDEFSVVQPTVSRVSEWCARSAWPRSRPGSATTTSAGMARATRTAWRARGSRCPAGSSASPMPWTR